MTTNQAPYLEISWTATALGASFGGYGVYRRPSRAIVVPWEKVGAITIPTGYTASVVEAQHVRFRDFEAGWSIAGGQWGDGWDYAVTVANLATGLESTVATVSGLNSMAPDQNPWVVSNTTPYTNFPIAVATQIEASGRAMLRTYHAAGRDLALTRTPLELPERVFKLGARFYDRVGEDPLRLWRAASASGRAFTMHLPRGDKVIGALDNPDGVAHGQIGVLEVSGSLTESVRTTPTADFNLPAGLVLNGTSQYVTVPHNAVIDASGPFTIVLAAVFPNPAAVCVYASKGTQSAGNGYMLMHDNATSATNMKAKIRGSSAVATLDSNLASWFDGSVHVATLTSSGTAQALYQDDSVTPVATGAVTTGSAAVGTALALGANNAGADGFSALAPGQTLMFFPRVLTPTEVQRNARYLLGYFGNRPAANASLMIDLRDDRVWRGYGTALTDISAIPPVVNGTVVSAPATRGIPWTLSAMDRFS